METILTVENMDNNKIRQSLHVGSRVQIPLIHFNSKTTLEIMSGYLWLHFIRE